MKKPPISRAESIRIREFAALKERVDLYELGSPKWGSPTFHHFVKGLILSSEIISIIKEHLKEGYHADWGQIIDLSDGNVLSSENDIIIYKEKPYKRWKNDTMNFVLVDKSKVVTVIQCSSHIESLTEEHRKYCKNLLKFTPEIWYFAERCWAKGPGRIKQIASNLRKAGYKKFFYLYFISERTLDKEWNETVLFDFVNLIEKIGNK
jgi:Domain of unknown function (DUF6602)